ncbi:hypothetical protein HDZ31DRAFT_65749 [Schizophyllum fasciatum]
MSRASSRDSRLSSNEGDRTASRGDGRPEVGWGAPVYPAAGPRGVKRPRSASPAPVAVDVPEVPVQHRLPLDQRTRDLVITLAFLVLLRGANRVDLRVARRLHRIEKALVR